MSRWARLRTLSSSATARRYCSQWLFARSSESASARCSLSSSTSCAAVSGSTVVDSAAASPRSPPDSLAVVRNLSRTTHPAHPSGRPQGWGSAPRIQGGAEQFSGHLDDGDDPCVGHRGGADHPEAPDPGFPCRVGGGHDAAVIEDLVAGLVSDEDLPPFGLKAVVEQVQEVALLVEGLEQPPQLLDVGELGGPHEVGLALDDVLEPLLDTALEDLLGDGVRRQHDLVESLWGLGR